jgi:predicted alpha/beta superfamily hydrolase
MWLSLAFTCLSLAGAPTLATAGSDTKPSAAPTAVKGEPYVMPRSEVRSMRSEAGADYLIHIAWPQDPPPPEGYPILYLLDGTESFAIVAEFANRLGSYSGLAPGVVVGIGYPGESRRTLDYTPAVPAGAFVGPARGPTGGADAFINFVANKVIPGVEAGHRVNADRRTLAGYSLGGLITLQALFKRPDLFRTYVAASPSIWYGDKQVLKLLPGFSERLSKAQTRRRLFLSAGEYEQSPAPGMERDPSWLEIEELSIRARMVDNARELAESLESSPLHVEFRVVPGETHATGDWPAFRDALRRAFGDRL